MSNLVQLIQWEITGFLLALVALITIQLLTGRINTAGLFRGRITGRTRRQKQQYFSPERVQLLISTVGASGYYLSLVLTNPKPGEFPPIPETWPAIVGGSNVIYLAGKAYARWFANRSPKKLTGG